MWELCDDCQQPLGPNHHDASPQLGRRERVVSMRIGTSLHGDDFNATAILSYTFLFPRLLYSPIPSHFSHSFSSSSFSLFYSPLLPFLLFLYRLFFHTCSPLLLFLFLRLPLLSPSFPPLTSTILSPLPSGSVRLGES